MMIKKIFILFIVLIGFQSIVFAGVTAEEVYKLTKLVAAESKDDIWPGFDPLAFIVIKENGLHFSPEPNNPKSQIFMSLSSGYFEKYTLEQNLAITVHEAFHGFERSPVRPGKKWRYENPMLVFEYGGTSARNNALFSIEAKILNEALKVSDESRLRSLARDFLLVREWRQKELDPRFVDFEKGAELNEGLAEYAGTKAVIEALRKGAAKKTGLSFEAAGPKSYVAKKYNVLGSISHIGTNVRRKFYYTGSAQALLLDQLMPVIWKTRVQMKGESLQDLLTEAVRPLDGLLETRNYQRILAEEEKLVAEKAAENRKLLQDTLSRKGTKFTVDFSGLGGSDYIQSFDPMNVTMIDPALRIHTRFVKFGKKDRFTALFNQPVVEDQKKTKYVSIFTRKVSVVADGVTIDVTKDSEVSFEKGLKVTSENVEFEAAKGKLVIRKGEIIVKLKE